MDERERARVRMPELIVAEERRSRTSLSPRKTGRDWLLFADCRAIVDGTVRLAKGTLALASFFVISRDAFPCPSSRACQAQSSSLRLCL